VFPEIPGFTPPGVLIPPPLPVPPPCDDDDDECEPPPPPTDMPEPGTLFILLVGAAALAFGTRPRRPATIAAGRGRKGH
jgi:hypothetical protein